MKRATLRRSVFALAGGLGSAFAGGKPATALFALTWPQSSAEGGALVDLQAVVGMRCSSTPPGAFDPLPPSPRPSMQLLARGQSFAVISGAGPPPIRQERASHGSPSSEVAGGVLVVSIDLNGRNHVARGFSSVYRHRLEWEPIERVRGIMRCLTLEHREHVESRIDTAVVAQTALRSWSSARSTRGVVAVGGWSRPTFMAPRGAIFSSVPVLRATSAAATRRVPPSASWEWSTSGFPRD